MEFRVFHDLLKRIFRNRCNSRTNFILQLGNSIRKVGEYTILQKTPKNEVTRVKSGDRAGYETGPTPNPTRSKLLIQTFADGNSKVWRRTILLMFDVSGVVGKLGYET